MIERSEAGPREAARSNRQRHPSRSASDNAFVKAKPAGRNFGKKNHAPPAGGPRPGKPAAKYKHKRKQP